MVLAKPFGGVASPRISPSPGPPSVPRQTVTQVAVWWEGADGGPWPLGAGAGGGPWRYLAAALLFPPLRCRATLTWWRGLASPRAFAVCWRARGGDQEPGDAFSYFRTCSLCILRTVRLAPVLGMRLW